MPRRDHIYDFLRSRGPADLYLDVGAASGEISERLAADVGQVMAYEPFPENARLFKKRLAGRSNIRLIEKAVSSRCGRTTLFVDSTVQGDEIGWGDQVGLFVARPNFAIRRRHSSKLYRNWYRCTEA